MRAEPFTFKNKVLWFNLNTCVSVIPLLAVGTLNPFVVCVSSGILQWQKTGMGSVVFTLILRLIFLRGNMVMQPCSKHVLKCCLIFR